MFTASCRFAHGFKIMRVPQPIIPFCVPLQPIQVIRSGRGGEIDVPCIRCLDGRLPEAYELWDLAEDIVCEVHLYARVELLYDFREDTFNTKFFNARQFQIPVLGHRAVNMSVKFLDVVRTTQHIRSRVASWTKKHIYSILGSLLILAPWYPDECEVSLLLQFSYQLEKWSWDFSKV